MKLRELRPRHRKHLRRRVQLHRAGAERNHRSGEREVARLEPPQVAQHLGLGVVRLKTGWVRKGGFCDSRLLDSRLAGGRARRGRRDCSPKMPRRISMSSGVVVSSSEMPMLCGPRPRRLQLRCRPRRRNSSLTRFPRSITRRCRRNRRARVRSRAVRGRRPDGRSGHGRARAILLNPSGP